MTKKRKVITGIVVMILILAGAGLWVWHDHEKDKERNNTGPKNILHYEQGSTEGNACMITDKNLEGCLIDGRYMIFYHFKYTMDWTSYYTPEVDYAVVNFYDLVTNEKLGSVDLTEIVKSYLEKGLLWDSDGVGRYRTEEGEFYLCITFTDNQSIWENVYLNVETGEVMEDENLLASWETKHKEKVLEWERNIERDMTIIEIDRIGLLENVFGERWLGDNNLFIYRDQVSGCAINIKRSMLPKENQLLYTEFPGLKEYEGTDEDWVCLYFEKNLTQEEIISLFVEEGEEISFEGCVLRANDSIDGQDHEIHSFEELEQWVDVE